jgi:hypothetical protein
VADEQQIDEIPVFNDAFQESFYTAMSAILMLPEHETTLLRFLSAYEYRCQFPWLEESQQGSYTGNQDGLAYALQAALATYIVTNTIDDVDQHTPRKSAQTLLPEQKLHLLTALQATIDEKMSLERFELRLARAELNVAELSLAELQKHILRALDHYYSQRMKGVANDPF